MPADATIATTLTLPGDPTLIVLCGVSGVGKSTWAHRLFPPTAVVSSDDCRGLIADDPSDQSVSAAAFKLVNTIAQMRLTHGRTTLIDSTALRPRDRRKLVALANDAGVPAMLVAFDGDMDLWLDGQRTRAAAGGRTVPADVIATMADRFNDTRQRIADGRVLSEEGFACALLLDRAHADAITAVQPPRSGDPARSDIDVISDVHGCCDELIALLAKLGYIADADGVPVHPDGRLAVFVGDLADRGPDSLGVVRLVDAMIAAGSAQLGSVGNHDFKNLRLFGWERDVKVSHGLDRTIAQVAAAGAGSEYARLCRKLFEHGPASSVYDDGRLVVVHGAVMPDAAGRSASANRKSFAATLALFGQTDGTRDDGFPNRIYDWAAAWQDTDATVVFGHDVMGDEPRWINDNVVGIDTGCAFGGRLTALRWPSREIVQVDALASSPTPATTLVSGYHGVDA